MRATQRLVRVRAARLREREEGFGFAEDLVATLNRVTGSSAPRDPGAAARAATPDEVFSEFTAGVTAAATANVESLLHMSESSLRKGRLAAEAVLRFNDSAQEHPITMSLSNDLIRRSAGDRGYEVLPDKSPVTTWGLASAPYGGGAYFLLWKVVELGALRRIRRCRQCGKWFVDKSFNNGAEGCSRDCTWAYWNRERRRAAHHSEYRKGGGSKRGKR